ncbi:3-hydroxyisobutyrate dehydrogenase, partial [Shigella dysenteriae]
ANMDWQKCSGIKRSYLGRVRRRFSSSLVPRHLI